MNADNLSNKGFIVVRKLFICGNKTLPILIPTSAILFLVNCKVFAVVLFLSSNSFCIEPAYLVESLTASKFFFSSSKFVKSGAIAPIDSLPNSCCKVVACSALLSFETPCRTLKIVFLLSFCISLDTFLESNPSFLNASLCDLVAASPATKLSIKFLIPVPATSDLTPTEDIVVPSAKILEALKPATSPNAPTFVTISARDVVSEAVTFDK